MVLLPRGQRGFMMLMGVAVMMIGALAFLVGNVGTLIEAKGKRVTESMASQAEIQDALVRYVSLYKQLPCPADPAGAVNAGKPNGDATAPYPAHQTCTYPTGVVPWAALGLSQDQAMDEWGRMISYRVFDGTYGLTQSSGATASNCDTTNGTIADAGPTVSGLCNSNHDTLTTSFLTHTNLTGLTAAGNPPTPTKGLVVTDGSTSVSGVAFVLISHGPTGLGGYTSVGTKITAPTLQSDAGDYPNTLSGNANVYKKSAASAPSVSAGTTGHYDDIVSYLTIADLLRLSGQEGRDWPEGSLPTIDAATTANMTTDSTNPLAPHFMSTGVSGSGQEFTAANSSGFQTLFFGNAAGAYSGCNWWPNKINLKTTNVAPSPLVLTTEFATADNTNDLFPGFTFGFLSGHHPKPTNTTCGTSYSTITATAGASGDRLIDLPSTGTLVAGMNVYGTGIPVNATISNIVSTTRIRINANKTANVTNVPLTFANLSLIRRDMGWAGGTLSSYTNKFAMEFDANIDATANDATTSPHIAVDRAGVIHGTDAESCTNYNYGGGCQRPPNSFSTSQTATTVSPNRLTVTNPYGITVGMRVTGARIAAGAVVQAISGTTVTLSLNNVSSGATTVTFIWPATAVSPNTLTVPSTNGVVPGMSVTGSNIGTGATVQSVSGTTLTLSANNTGTGSTFATFGTMSSVNFMLDGLTTFQNARIELQPEACLGLTATGVANTNTLTITGGSVSNIAIGMVAFGNGIRPGASVRSISGATITLSRTNSAAVSGPVSFALPTKVIKTATFAIGASTINLPDVIGVAAGMAVSGTGIASGTIVTTVSNNAGTALTVGLSQPTASAATSASLTFTPPNFSRAVSASSASLITVTDATYLVEGMNVYGDGIPAGTTILGISAGRVPVFPYVAGATSRVITLSQSATGTVTAAKFTSGQLMVKTWTISNTGCAWDAALCSALKSTTVLYGDYADKNNQVLHAVSCLPVTSPSNAYDSVYYGITTANTSTSGAIGNNLAIRNLTGGFVTVP